MHASSSIREDPLKQRSARIRQFSWWQVIPSSHAVHLNFSSFNSMIMLSKTNLRLSFAHARFMVLIIFVFYAWWNNNLPSAMLVISLFRIRDFVYS